MLLSKMTIKKPALKRAKSFLLEEERRRPCQFIKLYRYSMIFLQVVTEARSKKNKALHAAA